MGVVGERNSRAGAVCVSGRHERPLTKQPWHVTLTKAPARLVLGGRTCTCSKRSANGPSPTANTDIMAIVKLS